MPTSCLARTIAFLLAGTLAVGLPAGNADAQERRPLLAEGTSTVYQRVLTRPGTPRASAPGGSQTAAYPAFQPLYVFARDDEWLEVGRAVGLPPEGWVPEGGVISWRHNIVAAFANPAGRERQVLFQDRESLDRAIGNENTVEYSARLRQQALAGGSPEDTGVISIEPAEYVDINDPETFYVLPIIEVAEEFNFDANLSFLKMQIASIPLNQGETGSLNMQAQGDTSALRQQALQQALQQADAAIVLVLDTTMSMDPYIEETLEVVKETVERIKGGAIGDRVHVGVVGFRDNPAPSPGLEYRVRVFAGLSREAGVEASLDALAEMEAAETSSIGFNEDSLAAVKHALEEMEWRPSGRGFAKKFVILVTDAGPKRPGDPDAETDIDASALRTMAKELGVGLLAIHLQTPGGVANHDYASQQYRELTFRQGREYYYPVTGGREEFGAQIRSTITQVMGQLERNLKGELTPDPDAPTDDPPRDAALDVLGLAMELAYLGEVLDAQAPDVFRAWIADRALEDARKIAVEPRLLMTKNQLSTLREVLAAVLEVGERTQGDSGNDFFSQLKGAVSRMANDPGMLVNAEFETLGSAFGEFLEGLPYRSRVMEITEDRWENMGTGRRQIIDNLRSRFHLYERWHDDPGIWVPLYDGAPDGEHVFAMPFEALP